MGSTTHLPITDAVDILTVHESGVRDAKAALKRNEDHVTAVLGEIRTRIQQGESTGNRLTDFLFAYGQEHRSGNRARYERIEAELAKHPDELIACVYSEEETLKNVMIPNPHSRNTYTTVTHTLIGVIGGGLLVFNTRANFSTCTLPINRYVYKNDLIPHVHAHPVQEMRSPFSMIQRFLLHGDPYPDDFTREDQYVRLHVGTEAVRSLLEGSFDRCANALRESTLRCAFDQA